MAIVAFCNEVKGKSMLALSRDLGVQYKTAFVLAHKLREAMASSMKALRIGGEGRTAEIDGAYFGAISGRRTWPLIGSIAGSAPSTSRANAGLSWRCVSAAAVRLAQVFPAEANSVAAIRLRIAKGTVIRLPMKVRPGTCCMPASP